MKHTAERQSSSPTDRDADCVAHAYRSVLTIRRFEETVQGLLADGKLGGTTHLCIGQEAAAVGVCAALRRDDQVVSNHRGHGHLLAKGGDPARLLAELAGKIDGYCRGKGGSQHVACPEVGFMGSNGITGGGIPIAVGLALAAKMQGDDRVVVSFFGDGACTTGNFHESLNLAALWRLPIVFCCENNLYAMSNPVWEAISAPGPDVWAEGYGDMPACRVEGNDFHAVREATATLVDRARRGEGPGFVEILTYRLCGHSRSDPRVYRDKDEESWWRRHDPVARLAAEVVKRDGADVARRIEADVEETIAAAVRFAMDSPAGDVRLAHGGVFADEDEG